MVASWTGSCLSRLMISDPILLPSYRISESMREKSNHQDLLDRFWLKKAKEKELSASQGRSFPVRPTRAWEFRGRTATRTMFYMPYVTNLIAIGVVWNYILNPYKGPVNRLLRSLGIAEQSLPLWLSGNNSALPVAALIHTWVGLAFPVITLLARGRPAAASQICDIAFAQTRHTVHPDNYHHQFVQELHGDHGIDRRRTRDSHPGCIDADICRCVQILQIGNCFC